MTDHAVVAVLLPEVLTNGLTVTTVCDWWLLSMTEHNKLDSNNNNKR